MAENEIVKPVNPPTSWHLKKQYVDEIGNVFNKGKFIGTKTELNITDDKKYINSKYFFISFHHSISQPTKKL